MKTQIKPLVTEKSMLATSQNTYTFRAARLMRKGQIKKAVEEQYQVNVVKMRIMKMKGKAKTAGKRRQKIKLGDWKKALVTLKADQKIEGFGEAHETAKKQKTK